MRFIRENRNFFKVKRMCSVLGVSEEGYYRWLKRPPSRLQIEDHVLLDHIIRIHESSGKRYGSPKILEELKKQGFTCGHKRVERLMRENRIKSITVKKKRTHGSSVKPEEASENLLNRNFSVMERNKVWVTDITYIKGAFQWLYLCVFLDLYSRKVVGWSVSRNPNARLVLAAFDMACEKEQPGPGLMIHSDRGTQYGSKEYRNSLDDREFIQSMSRAGNCWDNACMESFFHLLKTEELNRVNVGGIKDLYRVVFRYIELFYNRIRIHSHLGYMSPIQFDNKRSA